MRSRIASVLFAASMLGAAPCALLAQPTSFTFKDGGPNIAWNFYVGNYHAYEGAVANNDVQTINCVDFYHGVAVPQTWSANLTNLAVATVGVTTRFSSITLYKEAAYLTTQYAGKSNADVGTIQAAIWHLFDGVNSMIGFNAGANNLDGVALNSLAPLSGASNTYQYWINQATNAAGANFTGAYAMNFTGYYVVTDVNACNAAADASYSAHNTAIGVGGSCHNDAHSVQEFIMKDPSQSGGQSSTPEPATLVLFGSGLLGIAGARIRRKK